MRGKGRWCEACHLINWWCVRGPRNPISAIWEGGGPTWKHEQQWVPSVAYEQTRQIWRGNWRWTGIKWRPFGVSTPVEHIRLVMAQEKFPSSLILPSVKPSESALWPATLYHVYTTYSIDKFLAELFYMLFFLTPHFLLLISLLFS